MNHKCYAAETDQAEADVEMDIIENPPCEIVHLYNPLEAQIIDSILRYDTQTIQALWSGNNVVIGFQNEHFHISGKNKSSSQIVFKAIMAMVAEWE